MHDGNFVYEGCGCTTDYEWIVEKVGVKNGKLECFKGFLRNKFFTLLIQLRDLDSLDRRLSMWSEKDRCSSKRIPRSL